MKKLGHKIKVGDIIRASAGQYLTFERSVERIFTQAGRPSYINNYIKSISDNTISINIYDDEFSKVIFNHMNIDYDILYKILYDSGTKKILDDSYKKHCAVPTYIRYNTTDNIMFVIDHVKIKSKYFIGRYICMDIYGNIVVPDRSRISKIDEYEQFSADYKQYKKKCMENAFFEYAVARTGTISQFEKEMDSLIQNAYNIAVRKYNLFWLSTM